VAHTAFALHAASLSQGLPLSAAHPQNYPFVASYHFMADTRVQDLFIENYGYVLKSGAAAQRHCSSNTTATFGQATDACVRSAGASFAVLVAVHTCAPPPPLPQTLTASSHPQSCTTSRSSLRWAAQRRCPCAHSMHTERRTERLHSRALERQPTVVSGPLPPVTSVPPVSRGGRACRSRPRGRAPRLEDNAFRLPCASRMRAGRLHALHTHGRCDLHRGACLQSRTLHKADDVLPLEQPSSRTSRWAHPRAGRGHCARPAGCVAGFATSTLIRCVHSTHVTAATGEKLQRVASDLGLTYKGRRDIGPTWCV
jgi:hypothetical protein